nr:enhancer of mRNA-decapping protein 3 [Onthophagus taurus]
MAQWTGYMVSVECGNNLGTFQGEILSVTDSKLSLAKAFCNGIPCDNPEVLIRTSDIIDLKLIDKQSSPTGRSTITVAKPIAKRENKSQSNITETNTTSNKSVFNQNGSHQQQHSNDTAKSKPIDINNSKMTMSEAPKGTPIKKERGGKGKWSRSWKDEACFGSPLGDAITKDFDFEKMLALFDKQAVWDEINSKRPDNIKSSEQNKKQTKYRHDENVISSTPASLRQIIVPQQEKCEYVTDDGLIVPSISRLLRTRLFLMGERAGISWERRTELMGRATTEMALQLLGGAHRLNPNNIHQMPTVVFLCGSNRPGSVGLNAARQLASHGVHTIVFVPNLDSGLIHKELELYKLTRNKVVTDVSQLPELTDLIIVSLCEESDNLKLYIALAEWTLKNKASVLAIDPPASGTPGIIAKYSLAPVLPLPHSTENGKIYLCNLGFPVDVFKHVDIMYRSPFGSKFVIPLHPNDGV